MKPTLHVLTGVTAVGKTEWALRWAEARGAEIVSCDSLLFYRGLDIGTAKPTAEERARVPHHLIDVCAINERMDVTQYVAQALGAVREIQARGRQVLVVGGSGFYLKSFFSPVADEVAVPAALRAEVRALPLAEALVRLQALNPGGLGALDTANPRRVTRALERCLASGRTLAALAEEFARQAAPFADWPVELTRLERPPEELEQRIEARVAAMLRDGLVAEVRRFATRGIAGQSQRRAGDWLSRGDRFHRRQAAGGEAGGGNRQEYPCAGEEAAHVVPHPTAAAPGSVRDRADGGRAVWEGVGQSAPLVEPHTAEPQVDQHEEDREPDQDALDGGRGDPLEQQETAGEKRGDQPQPEGGANRERHGHADEPSSPPTAGRAAYSASAM